MPRLLIKVKYFGYAPIYRKCRLHSNGQPKSSYDVTDYWRKMNWGGFSLHFSCEKNNLIFI